MKRSRTNPFIITLFLSMAILFACKTEYKEEYELKVTAPLVVQKGAVFSIMYTINAKPEEEKLQWALYKSGAYSHTVEMKSQINHCDSQYNGKKDTVKRIFYTFDNRVHFDTVGTKTIPPATIMVKGKSYTSPSITIQVLDSVRTKSDDLILTLTSDKEAAKVGEAFHIYLKLYSLYPMEPYHKVSKQLSIDLSGLGLDGKVSELITASPYTKGALKVNVNKCRIGYSERVSKTIDSNSGPGDWTFINDDDLTPFPTGRAKLNNREYEVRVLNKLTIIPSKAGKLTFKSENISIDRDSLIYYGTGKDKISGNEVHRHSRSAKPLSILIKD